MLASSTPSAVPVTLSMVLMRPFTPTRYCAGPTSPMVSGGTVSVSASVATSTLGVATVCARPVASFVGRGVGEEAPAGPGRCGNCRRSGSIASRWAPAAGTDASMVGELMMAWVVCCPLRLPTQRCAGVSVDRIPMGPSAPGAGWLPTRPTACTMTRPRRTASNLCDRIDDSKCNGRLTDVASPSCFRLQFCDGLRSGGGLRRHDLTLFNQAIGQVVVGVPVSA